MERDILKKVDRDLCWNADMRFRFIEDRRAEYPVRILCEVLGVSQAGYCAWRPGVGCGGGFGAEDRTHDFSENAHRLRPMDPRCHLIVTCQ